MTIGDFTHELISINRAACKMVYDKRSTAAAAASTAKPTRGRNNYAMRQRQSAVSSGLDRATVTDAAKSPAVTVGIGKTLPKANKETKSTATGSVIATSSAKVSPQEVADASSTADGQTKPMQQNIHLLGGASASASAVRGRGSSTSGRRMMVTLLRSKRSAAVTSEKLASDDASGSKQKPPGGDGEVVIVEDDNNDDGNMSSATSQVTIIENDEDEDIVQKLPPDQKQPLSMPLAQAKVAADVVVTPAKNAVSRRFADRSAKLPDDIYFGDVEVPLHVLYANDSDSDSDQQGAAMETLAGGVLVRDMSAHASLSSAGAAGMAARRSGTSRGRGRGRGRGGKAVSSAVASPVAEHVPGKRGRKPAHLSLNEETRLKHMKKCLKASGLPNVLETISKTGQTPLQQANAILMALQDGGLRGEATLENCARLRRSECASDSDVDWDLRDE